MTAAQSRLSPSASGSPPSLGPRRHRDARPRGCLALWASAHFARAQQPSLRQAPASLALPAPAFPVRPGPDRCGRRRAASTAGCCKARWAAGSVRARSAASGPGRSSAAAPSPASAACWRRRPAQGPGSGGRQAEARPRPEARPSGLVRQAAAFAASGNDLARAEDLPSPAQAPPAPLTPLFALVAPGREKKV